MVFRRANSFYPVHQFRDEMDRLVSNFFGPQGNGGTAQPRWGIAATGFPALNVWEDGDTIYAEAEVPGVKPEEIDISVVGSDLTIRGQRGGQASEGVAYHRQERPVGEFTRVLRLPAEVDGSKVEASLSNGVLLIKLPKAETAKPKKIKVATS